MKQDWEDYYEVLRVSPDSSAEEIKKAYIDSCLIYHPDRLMNAPKSTRGRAEEELKRINRAYEILGNPQERQKYHAEWIRRKGKPRPVADPDHFHFEDVKPGETKAFSFVVKNVGGPYKRLVISNPDSWVRVAKCSSLTDSDELPLQVEIEAEGAEWGKTYSEHITIKLDEEETWVKVELETKAEPIKEKTWSAGIPEARPTPSPAPPVAAQRKIPAWAKWLIALVAVTLIIAVTAALLAHSSPSPSPTPGKPDLTLQDITWAPTSPSIGETVTFTVIIKNQGAANAGSSVVGYYVDGTYLTYSSVSSILAGSTVAKTFTWSAQPGSHTIKAVADYNSAVLESNETNNGKEVTFSGTVLSDLIIQDITWAPTSPSAGETVTFTVTIKNQGAANAGSSAVGYYVDDSYLTYSSVSSISVGSTATKTFTWTAQPGSHTIKAVADYKNAVLESNETNNEKEVTLSEIPASDLIVQDITWAPTSPSAGETITFTVTIKNQGIANTMSLRVGYYVDGSYLSNSFISSIAPGNTVMTTFTWSAQPGSHAVKAVADYNNAVPESNETNNEKEVTFSGALLSDLIVQNITWAPTSPSAGETVTFTVSIKNQGVGAATSCYVYYFIDGLQKGYGSVSSILSGSTATTTFTLTAQPGSHTIKAVADYNNAVPESNETNNEKEVTLSGVLLSDLIVQDITWVPSSPSAGEAVTFTVTLKNQGTGNAVSSTIRYYIDGLYLTYDSVSSIPAGSTATETFTWSAQPGSHAIKAVADYNNAVPESNETNNEKEVALTIP